jgi:two-component system chemotaxis response regulator CheY
LDWIRFEYADKFKKLIFEGSAMSNSARIMIVDDEVFFRELLRDTLTKAGFNIVAEASSGSESIALYREHRPELVLMDIYMPEKNGIEATRDLIALDPQARIIICSGMGYDDDLNAAVAAGAIGVIYKPFYEDEVIEIIKSHL